MNAPDARADGLLKSADPWTDEERVDVIGIGVQKAGTSWIFRCLIEHPALRPSNGPGGSNKELNFFNHNYERGYNWYHRKFDFGSWRNAEYSVLYFHDQDVPSRVHRYNPNVKLLLSLRNPIDRAFSHHRHEVRQRRLPKHLYEFGKALRQNPSYIEQGKYATHLERWLEHFDLGQLQIVEYDHIRSSPAEVMEAIYEFLEVDPAFTPARLRQQVNPTVAKHSKRVGTLIKRSSGGLDKLFGPRFKSAMKSTGLPALVHKYNRIEIDERLVPRLTQAEREYLAELFAGENARLSELLGKDFSHWK